MLTVELEELDLSPGHRLLDLGCGSGRHTYAALQLGAHVVAVDLDVALAQEVAAMSAALVQSGDIASHVRAGFTVADATRLPFADASFDRIIVSEVLEHIADDDAALAEIGRVLHPDGKIALTVPRWWPERLCWALSDEYHSNDGGHVRIYRKGQLVELLEQSGLRMRHSHHAHALHAPYWWLKCASGVRDEEAPLPKLYHRFLVWQIENRLGALELLERTLNPVLGKSLVVYAEKRDA